MIAVDVIQGSVEWLEARAGVPSASNFDKIITTKGEPSKQRQKYMYTLAAERITGKHMESFQSDAMQRGVEMEAEARSLYEILTDRTVTQAGLCYRDESKSVAASPDGFVGEDGLIEIKCPLAHTHVEYLLNNELPMEYFQQVQGQLYVTGRKWVEFVSYFPGIKPLIVRVNRDEKFIAALDKEIGVFLNELNQLTEAIR